MAAAKGKGITEFRGLPEAELRERLQSARRTLWDTRQKLRAGAVQQTHQVRALRKDIAKMHTVLQERRVPRQGSGSQPEAATAAASGKGKAS